MALAIVKDNHLHFNGENYFRGGSEDVELGSYGEKKKPLTQTNHLEVQARIPAEKLKIKEVAEIEIDFEKSSKGDLLANISAAVVFKGKQNTAWEDLRSGKLKLVKFVVENEKMKDAINDSPKALERLIDYGDDARVAHQIFTVLEAEEAREFTSSKSFDISVSAGAIKVAVDGGGSSSGTTSVTLSKGMCFAYLLGKFDWDANQKKNKTRITKITDDHWSLN